jgi:hypothetical protein
VKLRDGYEGMTISLMMLVVGLALIAMIQLLF